MKSAPQQTAHSQVSSVCLCILFNGSFRRLWFFSREDGEDRKTEFASWSPGISDTFLEKLSLQILIGNRSWETGNSLSGYIDEAKQSKAETSFSQHIKILLWSSLFQLQIFFDHVSSNKQSCITFMNITQSCCHTTNFSYLSLSPLFLSWFLSVNMTFLLKL